MTLTTHLRAAGYTHREPTEADRREHHAHQSARAIVDERGECVAVLTADDAWAWLRGEA